MAIPGWNMLKGMGKTALGGVDLGIDAARGATMNWGNASGLIGMAGAGALAGGVIGGVGGDKDQAVTGAAAGGLIGAGTLPAIGFAGGATVAGASALWDKGKGPMKAARGIGSGIQGMGTGIGALAAKNTSMFNPLGSYTGMARNLGNNFASYTPSFMDYNAKTEKFTKKGGIKLTGLGKGIIGAGALVKGVRGGFDQLENSRMGQMSPHVSRATPRLPSYADNGGATGDLVFAMNANRQG